MILFSIISNNAANNNIGVVVFISFALFSNCLSIRNQQFITHHELRSDLNDEGVVDESTCIVGPKRLKDIVLPIVKRNELVFPFYVKYLDVFGQLQTIIQTFHRSITSYLLPLQFRRELLTTIDGGVIALDWITHKSDDNEISTKDIVMLFHGLCGSSSSDYLVHLADILLAEGFAVVVVVARGCGGLQLTSRTGFIPHKSIAQSDINLAIQSVRERYCSIGGDQRQRKLFGVGFSLGAAVLLKELAREGDKRRNSQKMTDERTLLTAAVCVSPPWNMLHKTVVFPLWSMILTGALKIYALTHYQTVQAMGVSIWKLMLARTLDEFDEHFISGYGFDTVAAYRTASSPRHNASSIDAATPTLVISAEDDPVCCISGAPHSSHGKEEEDGIVAQLESGLVIVKTRFGGHLGFPFVRKQLANADSKACLGRQLQSTWTDDVIVDWFQSFSSNNGANGAVQR